METKKAKVGKRVAVNLPPKTVKQALELRHIYELETGTIVSLTDAVTEAIARTYRRATEKEGVTVE